MCPGVAPLAFIRTFPLPMSHTSVASEHEGPVAVTGATGFLGQHITAALLQSGRRVRVLARDPSKAELLGARVDRVVVGDITDAGAVSALVDGCDVVVHLVSNFRSAAGPPESYRRINVGGTRCVLDACTRAGVRRLVHCSTIGVHGDVLEVPSSETSSFNPGDLYQETKLEAEQLCRRRMDEATLEIVVVRPCSIYGPGDLRMLKMFRLLQQGRFFFLGKGDANFHAVYIDDLVRGFMQVAEQDGIAGETFIIGGAGYLPLREYVACAARAIGVDPPRLHLPYTPFLLLARVVESLCVALRVEPPLHERRVRFFKNNRAFTIEKARRVLGYEPRVDLDEGMRRTVAWYREKGHL